MMKKVEEGLMMGLYWVSYLVQDKEDGKPWLCSVSESCSSFEEALKVIEKGRSSYRLLAAWIDTYDENEVKTTVFHECYVNALGSIR